MAFRRTAALCAYKTSPVSLRAGVTKGWSLTHSIPEVLYSSHMKNYLKMYYTIKAYLHTQNVRLLSFNMVPQDTTTVISMNIFWYKPMYRQVQSRRSKNLTHERKVLQEETVEDIDMHARMMAAALKEDGVPVKQKKKVKAKAVA